MSTSMNTTTMVQRLQQRIPMNLASQYCMDKLNEGYQWIEQQGAFVWNIVRQGIALPALSTQVLVPADMDVGKPISIYPVNVAAAPFVIPLSAPVPYVPMDEISLHEIYHVNAIIGVFSVFTVVANGGFNFIQFAPDAARAGISQVEFLAYYHKINPALTTPVTIGNNFFPTPDAFDVALIDLAEGEIKRNYGLSGGMDAVQKAQASLLQMLDKYRSPKRDLAGIMEEGKEAQEKQAIQAQTAT